MGRLRQQKTKCKTNVFKVAGNRSLKAKKQAKFNDNLKLVNSKNKQKIEIIDQELINLNTEVRQPGKEISEIKNNGSTANNIELKIREIQQYKEIEENCDQALEKLSTFAM